MNKSTNKILSRYKQYGSHYHIFLDKVHIHYKKEKIINNKLSMYNKIFLTKRNGWL